MQPWHHRARVRTQLGLRHCSSTAHASACLAMAKRLAPPQGVSRRATLHGCATLPRRFLLRRSARSVRPRSNRRAMQALSPLARLQRAPPRASRASTMHGPNREFGRRRCGHCCRRRRARRRLGDTHVYCPARRRHSRPRATDRRPPRAQHGRAPRRREVQRRQHRQRAARKRAI